MIEESLSRTALLLGESAVQRLCRARVAVFGIGGVGGHVAEALARSGVGALDLYDNDRVSESNINRQIVALHSTVGMYKTDVMAQRIRDIRPSTVVREHRCFFLPENADEYDFSVYDTWWMRWIPSAPRSSLFRKRWRWASPSSVVWARATNWTRQSW